MPVRGGQHVLSQVPLFGGLSKRALRHLADAAEEVRYMEGAKIVKEGDEADAFYVILEGEARVVDGRGRTLVRLRPGESFGEISVLDGGRRTASVVAETPLTSLSLSRTTFVKMLGEQPEMAMKMLRQLAGMLRRIQRPLSG